MHLRVLAVGNRQSEWVRLACDKYQARLPPNWRFDIVEIDPGKAAKASPDNQADRLLSRVQPNENLIVLDERGETLGSRELAAVLGEWQRSGDNYALVIGGADGLGAKVIERARRKLSLSALTLPHGLARVVLLEQLYRAHSLLNGHPYHRD